MITRELVIYVDNTMVAELRALKNSATGRYENDASVSVTIKDGGSVLAGPLVMAYLPNSRGLYRAILPSSIAVSPGDTYTAEVTANGPGGSKGTWALPVRALTRDR